MVAKIYPGFAKGTVKVPSSKSMGHRALICAALAKGTSIITNVDLSEDIVATIDSLRKLGADIIIEENKIIVKGIENYNLNEIELNANESGSTLRFLIPLASFISEKVLFKGTNKLLSRPLEIYENIYCKKNMVFKRQDDKLIISGKIEPDKFVIDNVTSSQFISGLLYLLPVLDADSIIKIEGSFESKSYVLLTLQMMKYFGVEIEFNEKINEFYIRGKQKYQNKNYEVEADFSQAAFFLVLGAINGEVKLEGLNKDSLQGDKQILEILENLKVNVKYENNSVIIKKTQLKQDIVIDLKNCPDLGPILTILLANNLGKGIITNAKRLRLKESDRIVSMEEELRKFKIDITSDENNIFIKSQPMFNTNKILSSHNDHRVFMSLSVLATLANEPVIISNPGCINKSYPNYIKDLKALGIKVEYDE